MDNAYTDVGKSESHVLVRFASGPSPIAAAGGAALLKGETNGMGTDFTHAVDAERVAIKSAGATTKQGVDSFYTNASTSPKMVYDAAGVLGWSPHNYAPYSREFDSSYWNKENCSVASNVAVAPNGLMEADQFIENSATGPHDLQQGGVTATTGRVSVYAKTAGRARFMLYDNAAGAADGFDLTTGTPFIVSGLPSAGSPTMQDAGNGWWRCSMATAGLTTVGIYLCSGAVYSYAGDGVSGVYLWGAQVNKGPVPLAYLPTTAVARFGLPLDHDPVTHAARGLLCEPQATNLVPQSAAGRPGFLWLGNGSTKTTSAQVDPSGGLEALQVVITPGTGPASGLNVVQYCTTVIGTTYTASMWCKGTAGQQMWFGMDNNATQAMQTLVTFTGAWQRVSKTFTATVTSSNICFECYDRSGGGAHLPAITFHIWGGQYEVGTVATSYIPTLAATVTRTPDNITALTSTFPFSLTACSMQVALTDYTANSSDMVAVNDGSHTEAIGYYGAGFYVRTGAAYQALMSAGGLYPKAAAAAQANNFRAAFNGVLNPLPDTAGSMPLNSANTLRIGGLGGVTGNRANMHLQKLAIVPRAWSDAELQSRST